MFHMIHVQILKIVILYSKILYWYMTLLINLQIIGQKKLILLLTGSGKCNLGS